MHCRLNEEEGEPGSFRMMAFVAQAEVIPGLKSESWGTRQVLRERIHGLEEQPH